VRRAALFASVGALGCVGTPTPLAPALAGSIGVPHSGVQSEALELSPKGDGYVRYRPKGPNYWGNPRLVSAIEQAAAVVHREYPGGAALVVGDLSARHGGQIPGHHSHRTGRDADLLWYLTTPSGAPVPSPGLVKIESDGLGRIYGGDQDGKFLRLDVERQWSLFKTMIEQASVQFLFVSRNVEALLIDYALARGEPLELVWRAETVMLQPGDSAPHDDHAHLRIACTPEETVRGCEGGGPYWEWLTTLPELAPLDEATLNAIAAEDPFELEPVAAGTPAQGDGA
jgi:penicillin-insensitive murein DD-endopeptidase